MARSDRDPLFFPPGKHPGPQGEEDEGYSAEVDTAAQQRRLRPILALGAAVLLLVLGTLERESLHSAWAQVRVALGLGGRAASIRAAPSDAALDSLPPQLQAQRLLERAARGDSAALAELAKRLEGWRGTLRPEDQLAAAVRGALLAPDLAVRAAAIEVDLAANNIRKDRRTVEQLIRQAEPGHDDRLAALWTLGELAGRGVEPDVARQAITGYVHDPQQEVRLWALDALALAGQDDSIAPLLDALRSDSSPAVRERAARDLARFGTLSREQRMRAVPELIAIAGDPAGEAQTRRAAFQSLREITGQLLPDDASAWRAWWTARK